MKTGSTVVTKFSILEMKTIALWAQRQEHNIVPILLNVFKIIKTMPRRYFKNLTRSLSTTCLKYSIIFNFNFDSFTWLHWIFSYFNFTLISKSLFNTSANYHLKIIYFFVFSTFFSISFHTKFLIKKQIFYYWCF